MRGRPAKPDIVILEANVGFNVFRTSWIELWTLVIGCAAMDAVYSPSLEFRILLMSMCFAFSRAHLENLIRT